MRYMVFAAVLFFPLAAIGALSGAVIQEITPQSSAHRAGLLVDDSLVGWEAPRLMRSGDAGDPVAGTITSPFDVHLLELEFPPLGPVTLHALRGSDELRIELSPGSFGMKFVPSLADEELAIYRASLDDGDSGKILSAFTELAERTAATGRCDAAAWFWGEATLRLVNEGRYEESQTHHDRSIAALCDDRKLSKQAWLLGQFGIGLWRRGKYELSIDSHEAALTIRRGENPNSLAVADSLMRLLTVTNNQGRFDVSGEYGHEALAIYERLAPGSMAHAQLLHSLGNRAFWSDHLDDAYRLYKEAADIRKVLEPSGLDYVRSLGTLGTIAWRQDKLELANSLFEQALPLFEEFQPGGNYVASTYTMLGHVAADRRDLLVAQEHYYAALKIRENTNPDSLGVANILMGIGNLERRRRNHASARIYLERAREIYTKLNSRHRIAMVNNNLSNIAADAGRLDEAEKLLLTNLQVRRELSPDGFLVATTLYNLARLAGRRDDFDQAEIYFLEAARIFENVSPGGLRLSDAMTEFGKLLSQKGDKVERAESYLSDGLALAEKSAPGTLFEATPLHALGVLARTRGQNENALSYFDRALTAFEAQRAIVGGSDEVQSSFADHYAHFYKDYIEVLLEAGQFETAFHVLERYRARVLLAMWVDRTPAVTELPPDLEQERLTIYRGYDRTLHDLLTVGESDSETTEVLANRLASLQAQREQLEQRIRSISPKLSAIEYPGALTISNVSAALQSDTVVLSYCVTPKTTYLFAVRGGVNAGSAPRFEVFDLGISGDELRESIEAFRVLMRAPPSNLQFVESLQRRSHLLYTRLMKPASQLLEGAARVLVIADGPLHFLPFAALVTNPPEDANPPNYVIGRFAIRNSVSVTTFLTLGDMSTTEWGDGSVAVFANPILGDAGLQLAPLLGSEIEAQAIAEIFPSRTKLYVQEAATERQAKSLPQNVAIAHFATHAVLDSHHPLDSYLALTPDLETRSNGLLQAWEVMEQLRLDAELVTLSGCETHLGKEASGEGLIGLTRAFQYAGAQSVVASLWAVSDRATAELMQEFYSRLRTGVDHDLALQEAQLQLIHSSDANDSYWEALLRRLGVPSELDLSHPFYWAGFQLVGTNSE